MKIKTTVAKPRNPLVVAARQRKAGAHRRSQGGLRQRMRLEVQRASQEARTG